MKREIKFRAWDNDNELFSYMSFSDIMKMAETLDSFESYFTRDYFTKNDEKTNNPLLMQFTKLKDKNGQDIYEGDIVITNEAIMTGESYSRVGSIGYREDIASFVFIEQDGEWDSIEIVDTIIGNIYENPELLK